MTDGLSAAQAKKESERVKLIEDNFLMVVKQNLELDATVLALTAQRERQEYLRDLAYQHRQELEAEVARLRRLLEANREVVKAFIQLGTQESYWDLEALSAPDPVDAFTRANDDIATVSSETWTDNTGQLVEVHPCDHYVNYTPRPFGLCVNCGFAKDAHPSGPCEPSSNRRG